MKIFLYCFWEKFLNIFDSLRSSKFDWIKSHAYTRKNPVNLYEIIIFVRMQSKILALRFLGASQNEKAGAFHWGGMDEKIWSGKNKHLWVLHNMKIFLYCFWEKFLNIFDSLRSSKLNWIKSHAYTRKTQVNLYDIIIFVRIQPKIFWRAFFLGSSHRMKMFVAFHFWKNSWKRFRLK